MSRKSARYEHVGNKFFVITKAGAISEAVPESSFGSLLDEFRELLLYRNTKVAVHQTFSLLVGNQTPLPGFSSKTSEPAVSNVTEALRPFVEYFRSTLPQYFYLAFVAIAALLVTLYGLIRAEFRLRALWQDKTAHAMNGYEVAFAALEYQRIAKSMHFAGLGIAKFPWSSLGPPASGLNPPTSK